MSLNTVRVMQEVGIDISGQKPTSVDEYLGKVLFQYLILVSDDAEKTACPPSQVSASVNTGCSNIR
jgi:protein-tyrosine-phosphatase